MKQMTNRIDRYTRSIRSFIKGMSGLETLPTGRRFALSFFLRASLRINCTELWKFVQAIRFRAQINTGIVQFMTKMKTDLKNYRSLSKNNVSRAIS